MTRVFVLLLCVFLPACAHSLARQLVAAPNNRFHDRQAVPDLHTGDPHHFFVSVGPPAAEIAVWVMEPKNGPARGTVILLHGFLANHNFVRGAAETFCQAGYRSILVDLRGHGESTGDRITFGVAESHDLLQVTDYLQAHQLAGKNIAVYGTSLGAAVAIQYAALDPRVATVIAVAPFATLKDETPHFARTLLPFPGLFLSDADYAEVLKDAGEIASFNPDDANPLAAITRTHAKILLIHGALDMVIPADQSRRLHAAAPESELSILPFSGHWDACADLTGEVPRLALRFLDKHPPVPAAANPLVSKFQP
jgi:pimeloyl-ACP methyl ester carboxylesterase